MRTKKVIRILKEIFISIGFLVATFLSLNYALNPLLDSFVKWSAFFLAVLILIGLMLRLKYVTFAGETFGKQKEMTRRLKILFILREFLFLICFFTGAILIVYSLIKPDYLLFIVGMICIISCFVLLFIFASMTNHPKKETNPS